MTCWPQCRPISSAKMRARMSVTEPAPNGTTTVTRWVGQACADAGAVTPTQAAVRAAAPNMKFRTRFIMFLLGRLFCERRPPTGTLALFCHQFVQTPTKILEHHRSGITPRPAGDRAAGMRGGTGLVEPRDR